MTLNYHLMHPGDDSMPGDPNAAYCLDGIYHLHYILKHPWQDGQSYSFVHVTSPDMLHWTWQTTELQPSFTGHGMFSGTGFITKDGRPAVIYHGEGTGRNYIAVSIDQQLSAWEQPHPVEVQNPDGSSAEIEEYWDPDCFLIGDTYYAISGGVDQPLFKSKDLKHWTYIGDFLSHELSGTMIGEDISCPNFFKLDERWMLLCISHKLGARYYLGDWDAQAEQFVPQKHGRMNWKREEQAVAGLFKRTDFFAPESVQTPDGRRVMWAWLTGGPDNELLNKTIQSIPRELSLPADGTLRIKPLRELEEQRYDPLVFNNVMISNPITGHCDPVPPTEAPALQKITDIDGDAYEIRIVITREEALRKLFGFIVSVDQKGVGFPIMLRPETGTLRVGTSEAPFDLAELPDDEDIELRIFVDNYLIEVFANSRQALFGVHTGSHIGSSIGSSIGGSKKQGLDAFSVGESTALKSVEIWKLKPTNQGFHKAQHDQLWKPETVKKK